MPIVNQKPTFFYLHTQPAEPGEPHTCIFCGGVPVREGCVLVELRKRDVHVCYDCSRQIAIIVSYLNDKKKAQRARRQQRAGLRKLPTIVPCFPPALESPPQ